MVTVILWHDKKKSNQVKSFHPIHCIQSRLSWKTSLSHSLTILTPNEKAVRGHLQKLQIKVCDILLAETLPVSASHRLLDQLSVQVWIGDGLLSATRQAQYHHNYNWKRNILFSVDNIQVIKNMKVLFKMLQH